MQLFHIQDHTCLYIKDRNILDMFINYGARSILKLSLYFMKKKPLICQLWFFSDCLQRCFCACLLEDPPGFGTLGAQDACLPISRALAGPVTGTWDSALASGPGTAIKRSLLRSEGENVILGVKSFFVCLKLAPFPSIL